MTLAVVARHAYLIIVAANVGAVSGAGTGDARFLAVEHAATTPAPAAMTVTMNARREITGAR